ncbi:MAG: PD40 domain-containing protein, partial [Thermoplasmata archaeon]|nr:PD40 domain-containing protein [Thermoplasmata archaeon]
PEKPPPPPPPEGTIYFQYYVDGDLVMSTMKGDGSEKTILGVDYCTDNGYKKFGGLSRLKHGDHYWFIRFCDVEGEYPGYTQVKELFAVRDDGTMEVQLTDDPTLENDNWRWDPVFGIDDVNITFGAKRWIEGEEVPVDFGIYSAPIAYDGDGNIIGLSAVPIRVWDTGYRLTQGGEYLVNLWTFDWSPDESEIVYAKRNGTMYVADLGTGSESYLTGGCNPRWSPDGTKIVFLQFYRTSFYGGLGTISPDGTDEQIIVERSSKGRSRYVREIPDWSPDSKYLVYVWAVPDKHGPGGDYYIYIVAANGDNPTCLTKDLPSGGLKYSHTWR